MVSPNTAMPSGLRAVDKHSGPGLVGIQKMFGTRVVELAVDLGDQAVPRSCPVALMRAA